VFSRISSCQAAIFFGVTASGARSPYDTAKRVAGAWHQTGEWVDTDHGPAPRMRFDPRKSDLDGGGYVTHWKTCPDADQFRPPTVNPGQLHIVPEEDTDEP
jgi:hypothetical protein